MDRRAATGQFSVRPRKIGILYGEPYQAVNETQVEVVIDSLANPRNRIALSTQWAIETNYVREIIFMRNPQFFIISPEVRVSSK